MNKRDELIAKYASDIKEKFGEEPDMALLMQVTVGLGPSIYNSDASKVSGTDGKELERVKNNYLVKKLGLLDSPELMKAVRSVVEGYGRVNKNKYRAVVYYLLCRHFNKGSAYYESTTNKRPSASRAFNR